MPLPRRRPLASSARAGRVVPGEEGPGSQEPMVRRPEPMPSHPKEIPDEAVHRHEALRLSGGLEPAHLALPLARRLVGQFGPIVLVLRRVVHDCRHHAPVGRGVAAQLVRDQPAWRTALSFQQLPKEAFRRMAITPGLHEDVDHIAVVIDRAPEVLLAPSNGNEQLVKVPRVAEASLPTPQLARIGRPERAAPLANRFVGDDDARLGDEIFGVAEAETKSGGRARPRG